MSFKSGTILKEMATSATQEANERADQDAEIAKQQATARALEKGAIHMAAKRDEIPAGYARFCSAHKSIRYINKKGESFYFIEGRLDTDDSELTNELRDSIKKGNATIWEVKPENVAAPTQPK